MTETTGTAADGTPAPETGKSAQLASWVRDYSEDLKRFLAKRRVVESDIKDVCQEVYLRLLRFERAEVVKNPMAYLFRVAANVSHDFKLRQREWTPLEPGDLNVTETAPNPEESAELVSRQRRLLQALKSLPPLPRAALALQTQDDLTYEAIAERLGTSRRAVKRAVARGHALIREALSKDI